MAGLVMNRDVDSAQPTDTQHPKLYEYAALGSGVIALACVISVALLAAFARDSEQFAAVITGLVSIGTLAVNGLVQLLKPRNSA